jgi:hypothetical protein
VISANDLPQDRESACTAGGCDSFFGLPSDPVFTGAPLLQALSNRRAFALATLGLKAREDCGSRLQTTATSGLLSAVRTEVQRWRWKEYAKDPVAPTPRKGC